MFLRGEFNRWGEASEGIQASFHDLGFRVDSQMDKKMDNYMAIRVMLGLVGLKLLGGSKGLSKLVNTGEDWGHQMAYAGYKYTY